MKKYEIYANGKVAPLTTVMAKYHYFQNGCLVFYNSDANCDVVAKFNWNNISGFKEVKK